MSNGLVLMYGLEEADVSWLFSIASERILAPETVLIRERTPIDRLTILLKGFLTVTVDGSARHHIATVGEGQIVGELSFIERKPASSSVSATEEATVLEIPFAALDERIAVDPAFGSRFHRALARVLARRLRRSVSEDESIELEGGDGAKETGEAPQSESWSEIDRATSGFTRLLESVEASAVSEPPSEVDSAAIQASFSQISTLLNRLLGPTSKENHRVREEIGRRLRSRLGPFLRKSALLDRILVRPRGVPDDYRVLQAIYDRSISGRKGIGPALDRAFLAESACEGMRERRKFIADLIVRTSNDRGEEPTLVTSLVSGPADEIFDAYGTIRRQQRLQMSLVELDTETLHYVMAKCEKAYLEPYVKAVKENVLYLATGRSKVALPPQDLVYSNGLLDRHDDATVVSILNYMHGLLRPGGQALLVNVQALNPSRELFEYLLDWRLVHRTREELNALCRASAFRRPCERIRVDPKGIYIFGMISR